MSHSQPVNVEAVLLRYVEIQRQEQALKEEKAQLQDALADHLEREGLTQWFPEVEGQKLKVRCQKSSVVEYDEETLRARLGDRYRALLAPDVRKIRNHLAEIAGALDPVLDIVGSPAPEKVKAAIDQAVVRREDFAGAFRKTVRRAVSVSRVRPETPAPADDPGPDPATRLRPSSQSAPP
jgi:hypothetical protein